MDYIFILGTHPAWSVAEISSVLGEQDLLWEKERILVKQKAELNVQGLMQRLGGVLKIAVLENSLPANISFSDLAKITVEILQQKAVRGEGKLVFGLSDQGLDSSLSLEKLGLQVKKELKKINISSRLVTSQEKELSSVVVGQNKLLSKGAELIFYHNQENIIIARTLAIQKYKDLSRRDYGRPARDDHSGMLPPKLAQIMINVAAQTSFDDLLLDPFCGSGTIITEAMLMGYKNLIGTDLSEKAIRDSRVNAEWIRELYQLETRPKFHIKNATRIAQFLKTKSVDTIVTEPYLGPQRGLSDIILVIDELESLYSQALENFYQILKPGGRVVMVWPVFFGQEFLEPNLDKWRVISALPNNFLDIPWLKQSFRKTLLYNRPGQKVWRELIILEK